MALVNGPLFSLDASGQVGKALVYSKWKGRAYVREYVTPANPRSLEQQFQRGILGAMTKWWQQLTQALKDTWTILAAAGNFSTFNAMQKYNLDREGLGDYPIATADATGAAVTGVSAAPTGTGGDNTLQVTHTPATPPVATDVLLIGLGVEGGINTTAQDIHRIIGFQTGTTAAGATVFNFSDIPAGDYFVAARYVGQDGSLTAWTPSAAAITVTGLA